MIPLHTHTDAARARDQIRDRYRVEQGIIRSPGQFEGEPEYLPHYYTVYLDGFATEGTGGVLSVMIDPEERTVWPELGNRRKYVRFIVRHDGFVSEVR